MSIELDPTELGFERPFSHEVARTLRIKNNNYYPVAFKVKTTAPKQYCVGPNPGRIEAGKDVEVQVLLQAMKDDPPPGFKCRDKFLVQSVAITADKECSNVEQIWALIENHEKSAIQEKKIRVTFLEPGEKPTASNGEIVHDIAYSSPSPGNSSHELVSQLAEAKATIARLQEQVKQERVEAKAAMARLQEQVKQEGAEAGAAIARLQEQVKQEGAEVEAAIARLQEQVKQEGAEAKAAIARFLVVLAEVLKL